MLKSILLWLLRAFRYFFHFFRILVLFHSISPTSHRSSHSIPDFPVGMRSRTVLGTIRHILFLRHCYLLTKHSIYLGPVIIRRVFMGYFAGLQDTSPKSWLILPRDPDGSVSVRYRGFYIRFNILDMGFCPFSVFFNLYCVQEVTPICMIQGEIVLLVVLQLILQGCGESVLNYNTNFTDFELLVA